MANKKFRQHDWGPALDDDCRQIVRLAVREDLDRGQDWTTISLIPAESQSEAEVVVRAEGVVAGLATAQTVLGEMDTQIRWLPHLEDGAQVKAGQAVARLEGSTRDILTSERILLNFLGHLRFSQKETIHIAIISENSTEIFGEVIKSPFFPKGFFFI